MTNNISSPRWVSITGWSAIVLGSTFILGAMLGSVALMLMMSLGQQRPASIPSPAWYFIRALIGIMIGVASVVAGRAFLKRRAWSRKALQGLAVVSFVLGGLNAFLDTPNLLRAGPQNIQFRTATLLSVGMYMLVLILLPVFALFLGRRSVRAIINVRSS